MNHRTINVYEKDDEEIVKELYSIFKNTVINIFIFILCIFLFMNPFLLSNVLLFMSIFMLVKVCLNVLFSPSTTNETTLIKEKEEDKSLVSRLLKQNKILKNKINNLEKEEKVIPKLFKKRKINFITEPFVFDFKQNIIKDDVKDDVKDDLKDDLKEDIKEDVKEDKIVSETIEEDLTLPAELETTHINEEYENDFEEDINESYSILEKENDESL